MPSRDHPPLQELASRFGDTWSRGASNARWRDGGTADGSDASAATMAASGSMSGCRPRRAPHSSESVS